MSFSRRRSRSDAAQGARHCLGYLYVQRGTWRVLKTPSRLHVLCSALQQNGFSRFAKNWRNSSQSAFKNISGIYASARALRALWLSRDNLTTFDQWEHSEGGGACQTSWPNVPRPVDGTRTDGDGWALSGRRGGRLYKLYRIPARPLKPFLLSSRAR